MSEVHEMIIIASVLAGVVAGIVTMPVTMRQASRWKKPLAVAGEALRIFFYIVGVMTLVGLAIVGVHLFVLAVTL